jgi:hypothetical protein
MRNSFAATVRVVQVPKTSPRIRRLSLEEESLILDQANRDQQACTSGLQEVNRQLEISDALEDLAVVASRIREASPTELQLIATAGQAGVAGTDNEPELMLPAMEGFQEGKSIAFESMAEKAKMLWKNILEFIARMWEKFMAFFRIHVVVAELKRKLAQMKQDLAQNQKYSMRRTETGRADSISQLVHWFSFEGAPLKTSEDTIRALTATAKVAGFIYDTYANEIEAVGTRVEGILSNFKPDSADETLHNLVRQLGNLNFGGLPSAVQEGNDNGFDVATCQSFLGNGMLVAKTFKANPNMPASQALEGIRNSGISLEKGDAEGAVVSGGQIHNAAFFIPEKELAVAALQGAETLLGVIENFHKNHAPKLKVVSERLKVASNKAVEAFAGSVVGEGAADAERELKAALNLNAMFARWAQNPTLPFYSYIVSACRFVLAWCQMSIDNKVVIGKSQ